MSPTRCFLCSIGFISLTLGTGAIQQGTSVAPEIVEHPVNRTAFIYDSVTLNCKAVGEPKPTVRWYKDGQRVTTRRSKKILQWDNGLFFRIPGRNMQDSGSYWCTAENEAGMATSRPAYLTIVFLDRFDEFLVSPSSVESTAGQKVTIHCAPPRGYPTPVISWTRNGQPMDMGDGRTEVEPGGSLVIHEVDKKDEGRYQCSATNGFESRKTSNTATLSVLGGTSVAPEIVVHPVDTKVFRNEFVTLNCGAIGEPDPTVRWYKDGQLVTTRSHNWRSKGSFSNKALLPDNGLSFRHVRTQKDPGTYWCTAENEAGMATSRPARLTVVFLSFYDDFSQQFRVSEGDIVSSVGEKVTIHSNPPSGEPTPVITWTRNGQPLDMEDGRIEVETGGSLVIHGVDKMDAGKYHCIATNVVGVRKTVNSATLRVHDDLNGAIGKGYRFEYENGRPGLIGQVDLTSPYLGGDPGCCKICRENPHTAGETTEFFNFEWYEYGPNTWRGSCSCMNGPKKTIYPYGQVLGHCGNDTSFLEQVDGSLGEDRVFNYSPESLRMFRPVMDAEDPENVNDCCVKCEKRDSGVEMVSFSRYFKHCDCYKSIPGKRTRTYGNGYYAGFCDDR